MGFQERKITEPSVQAMVFGCVGGLVELQLFLALVHERLRRGHDGFVDLYGCPDNGRDRVEIAEFRESRLAHGVQVFTFTDHDACWIGIRAPLNKYGMLTALKHVEFWATFHGHKWRHRNPARCSEPRCTMPSSSSYFIRGMAHISGSYVLQPYLSAEMSARNADLAAQLHQSNAWDAFTIPFPNLEPIAARRRR